MADEGSRAERAPNEILRTLLVRAVALASVFAVFEVSEHQLTMIAAGGEASLRCALKDAVFGSERGAVLALASMVELLWRRGASWQREVALPVIAGAAAFAALTVFVFLDSYTEMMLAWWSVGRAFSDVEKTARLLWSSPATFVFWHAASTVAFALLVWQRRRAHGLPRQLLVVTPCAALIAGPCFAACAGLPWNVDLMLGQESLVWTLEAVVSAAGLWIADRLDARVARRSGTAVTP